MKMNKSILVLVIAGLMLTSLFLPMNTKAKAEKPEWNEGDEWSMEYEKELDNLFAPSLDQLDDIPDQNQNIEDLEYSVDGKVGFYQIYKVTEATSEEYTMSIKAGGGLEVSGDFSITTEMPKEGTYSSDEEPAMTDKTISGDGSFEFSQSIEGTAHFTNDLELKDMDLEITLKISGDFNIKNFPRINRTSESMVVEYENYDGGASGKVKTTLNIEFSPALDIFNFPIEVGEKWNITSEAIISGSYQGEIDAYGLPKELEDQLENQDINLPMKLEDYDTNNETVHDGIIEEQTDTVEFKGECTGTEEIVMEDDTTTEVYMIEFYTVNEIVDEHEVQETSGTNSMELMYSPEEGFIVSQKFSSSNTQISGMIDSDNVVMEPTSEESAEKNMKSMQEMDDGDDSSTPGFTLIALMLSVSVVVIYRYRKNR